jgi:hypothetical protein
VKIKLHSPTILTLFACLGLALAPAGCSKDPATDEAGTESETAGDGDGDQTGDGDGDGDPTGDGDGDPTGDGDPGDGDGDPIPDMPPEMCVPDAPDTLPMGGTCTVDEECASCNCYLVPFLSGQCGQCNEDADCADSTGGGCTPPNPFMSSGSTCNMGEAGGGCETSDVCQDGLSCGIVLDLLGLIQISTCGECESDADCDAPQICAPVVIVEEFNGQNTCIDVDSLPQNSFCNLEGNGDDACTDFCSEVDIMGIAQVGACGECRDDADCDMNQTCMFGEFVLESGMLVGSVCG